MSMLRIALLQLLPGKTVNDNIGKGIEYCRRAKELGADIALFPEMWSCGYRISPDDDELFADSLTLDGDYNASFSGAAKELELAIGVTLLERYTPCPRNTMLLFDRHGDRVLSYAKVHTCDFDGERRLTSGEGFAVTKLDTQKGSVKVGAMICYDREFPESARILMLMGAELILVPNACPLEINRISQLRGRAYENMCAIATCNYPLGQPDCNGHSCAFDGIAYLPGLHGSRDCCVLEAGEGEGIFMAEIDLQLLRDYRASEVHGNAYRRPEKYSVLLDKSINEPFIRPDRRA